jgi:hypothetical protein
MIFTEPPQQYAHVYTIIIDSSRLCTVGLVDWLVGVNRRLVPTSYACFMSIWGAELLGVWFKHGVPISDELMNPLIDNYQCKKTTVEAIILFQ